MGRQNGTRSHDSAESGMKPALFAVAVAVALAMGAPQRLVRADTPEASAAKRPAVAHTSAVGTLDKRVQVLSKALELNPVQQAQLRAILLGQREAVRKIWSDSALLPAERAPATRAMADRTADQIRAMLTEEQKKKYNPPKPPPSDSPPPDVSKWIQTTQSK
jgi:hypothetical protein